MDQALLEGLNQITQANKALGIYGAVAATLVVLLRLYRLPVLQNLLPAVVQWSNLKKPIKLAIVFIAAAGAAALGALVSGGASVPAILIGALVTGLGALGINESTEGVGHTLAPMLPENMRRSKAGQITSLIVPMPKDLQAPKLEEEPKPPGFMDG